MGDVSSDEALIRQMAKRLDRLRRDCPWKCPLHHPRCLCVPGETKGKP